MALSLFVVICALVFFIVYMKVVYKLLERLQRKLNHEEEIKDKLLSKRGIK